MAKKINIIDAGLSPKTLEQLDLVGINGGLTEQTEGNYCTAVLTPSMSNEQCYNLCLGTPRMSC